MNVKATLIGTLAFVLLAASSFGAAAETAKEKALGDGAKQLTSNEIAERLVGRTGTWVSPSGDKKVRIYYGRNNDLHGKLVGGDWSGTGYYGVANDDSICISWEGSDKGRLRCFEVLIDDGVIKKFNVDGGLNGSYENFEDGKIL
jgi:hypothetical protein